VIPQHPDELVASFDGGQLRPRGADRRARSSARLTASPTSCRDPANRRPSTREIRATNSLVACDDARNQLHQIDSTAVAHGQTSGLNPIRFRPDRGTADRERTLPEPYLEVALNGVEICCDMKPSRVQPRVLLAWPENEASLLAVGLLFKDCEWFAPHSRMKRDVRVAHRMRVLGDVGATAQRPLPRPPHSHRERGAPKY
jgi:hypothetical protein